MKTNYRQTTLALLGLLVLTLVSCSKKENKAEEAPAPESNTTEAPAPAEKPVPAAEPDYILVEATHAKPKPADPVVIRFQKFRVTEADFDPADLTGATATIEIDVASLKSDKKGRDEHLREADYLDTDKHPTATVTVRDVDKQSEKSYSATLDVDLHGQQASWEVDFVVAESTESSVTIEMQHTFERRSFGVGAEDASPAQDVLAKVRLTFEK